MILLFLAAIFGPAQSLYCIYCIVKIFDRKYSLPRNTDHDPDPFQLALQGYRSIDDLVTSSLPHCTALTQWILET